MADAKRELALLVTGKDVSATKTLKGVGRQMSMLEKHGGKAARNIGRNIETGVVVGATAAAGALGYAVKQAIDRESAIAGIAKTVDGNIDDVIKSLTDMSNRIPMSFEELAGIAELGGAMGVAKGDLAAFTEQVAILGTTTDIASEDAATALGQMQNVIGLTGDEFDNFAAALVDLGNKGASTESQILEIARRSGGAGKLIGVAKDETLGWAAAAANLAMGDELAGTALQSFFIKTQKAISGGGNDLKQFAKVSGRTVAQVKKDWKEDASGALTTFIAGLSELSKGRRIQVIEDLYGKGSGMTRLIIGLADSYERNLIPSLENGEKAWDEATAAQEEANRRFATTESQLIILRNNIDNAAATIGTELLPVINELAKEGVDWLGEHQEDISRFGEDLAVNIREAVTWAKSLDWDAIGSALGTAAGGAKAIVDVFTGLPPEVMAILAGAYGANKITGGVVVDIVGDFFKKGGSPANPLWVAPVGGGLGGGAPLPGGGGGGRGGGIVAAGKGVVRGGATLGLLAADAILLERLVEEWGTFQDTRDTSQATLQERVESTSTQDFDETIANLNATVSNIKNMPLWDQLIVSGFGGAEVTKNFNDAANRLVANQTMTADELRTAISTLESTRSLAQGQFLDTTVLDEAIATLSRRLKTVVPAAPRDPGQRGSPRPAPREAVPETRETLLAEKQQSMKLDRLKAATDKNVAQGLTQHRKTEQVDRSVKDSKSSAIQNARNLAANQQRLTAETKREIAGGAARTTAAERAVEAAMRTDTARTVLTLAAGFGFLAATIRANRPVVNVSPTTVQNTTVVQRRTGPTGGDRSGPLEY